VKEEFSEIFFGSVWDRGDWREHSNAEINELIKVHDIVSFVNAQRIRWLRHVVRMSERRMSKRMLKGRKRKGRPRTRWLDIMLMESEAAEEKQRREQVGR
jgi:hypothetical protein